MQDRVFYFNRYQWLLDFKWPAFCQRTVGENYFFFSFSFIFFSLFSHICSVFIFPHSTSGFISLDIINSVIRNFPF